MLRALQKLSHPFPQWWRYCNYYPHFINGETEAAICPRPYSQQVEVLGFGESDSRGSLPVKQWSDQSGGRSLRALVKGRQSDLKFPLRSLVGLTSSWMAPLSRSSLKDPGPSGTPLAFLSQRFHVT